MADKYFRLVTVIVNVCPVPFRKLLIDMASNESNKKGIQFTDIDNYLKQKSTKVLSNSRFTRDQLNLLYPPPPGKADVNNWDLTLLSALLETLFGKALGPAVITCMKKLRQIRNDLQHKATTLAISDTEFQQIWKDILTETANAANVVGGPKYEKEIKIEILAAGDSFMPTLGVVLLQWYNSVILETKVNTDQIKEDTQQMRALLEGTAVKRRRRSGSDLSHFRALNHIQDALIRNFKLTKNACRETDFVPPERTLSKISKCLSDRNFVIISGYGNSKYLHAALFAIQCLNLEDSYCAELSRSEELFSINMEELGLLLLRSSFLSKLLGQEHEFIIYSLNRLQYHISHGDNPLKVVMLSDKVLLEKFRDQHQHELLTTAIYFDTPTSPGDPEDLTKNDTVEYSDTARSMLAWSSLFLQERGMTFNDDTFLKRAEKTFRQHNCVVCLGESACGRAALAVHLAKLHRCDACFVITDPDDLKYIELGKVDVLIILDFAGRFRYDEAKVYKWLEKFDLLYDAVRNRILSVIITCQESRLRMCREEAASHIMLEQTIPISQDITMSPKKGCKVNTSISDSAQRPKVAGDSGHNLTCGQNIYERQGCSFGSEDDAGFAPSVVMPSFQTVIVGPTADDGQRMDVDCESNTDLVQVLNHIDGINSGQTTNCVSANHSKYRNSGTAARNVTANHIDGSNSGQATDCAGANHIDNSNSDQATESVAANHIDGNNSCQATNSVTANHIDGIEPDQPNVCVAENGPVMENNTSLRSFEPVDVEIKHHNITKNDTGDDFDSCVWGICQLPDKSFVILDYYKQLIKQYDTNIRFIKRLSVTGSAKSICCTGHNQITIAFEKAFTVLNVKSGTKNSLQTDISPDMITSDMRKLFVMDKTSRMINVYDLNNFSLVDVIHVPVVETYSPAFCNSLAISQSGEKFYIVYLNMIKCFNKYGVVLATYEMPVHNESRKYRKFTQTVMCPAGDDFLLFIAQGNKEQIKERFIFLDSSLHEYQKGDIKSENHNTPAVMCFDKYGKRAILGYKQGPFVTDVHFRSH